MQSRRPAPPASTLDDRYLAFLRALAPSVAHGKATLTEVREAASLARLPWQAGGPQMDEIAEAIVQTSVCQVRIRTFYPAAERPLPAIVYFHGGGWTLLGLDTHDRIMREYATASGWAVVGVEYPRAPEFAFPDTVAVCRDLLERVASGDLADVRRPLVLAGDSSGANLAIATALSARDTNQDNADALILNYGVYDGIKPRASYGIFSDAPFTLTRDRMAWFWDQYCPDPTARRHPHASPLHADLRGLPAIRMVTTGLDVLRDENREFLLRLFDAGNTVSLDHHPRAPHAFLEAITFHDEPLNTIASSAAWLNQVCRGALKS
jgi:acetyl esterase